MIGDYQLNDPVPKQKRIIDFSRYDTSKRLVYRDYPIYMLKEPWLTEFKEKFPTTSNEDLRSITLRTRSYTSRLGSYLGLKKTKEFMLEAQQKNSRLGYVGEARYKNKPKKGELPKHLWPYVFGNANVRYHKWTEEEKKAMSESRKEIFRREKLRVKWGLPQLTKLKVTAKGHQKICYIWNIRHKYNYEEVEYGVFVYDADTKRGPIIEKHPKHGVKFYSREEWNEIKNKKAS